MKKLMSLLLAAMLLLSLMSWPAVTVSAESLYIRKIVSVVYDDSGSMKGDKWAYANYAMQAFCGMLNSEDQLYVTYMSSFRSGKTGSTEKIDLSADGIQKSITSIKKHTSSWSTPYEAVKTAYNKLKSVNDPNPNTQYWLVVITDGAFDETNSMDLDRQKQFLNDELGAFSQGVMPNGTNPQVTFLGIGGVAAPDENRSKGIYCYEARTDSGQGEAEIIHAMSGMADRISGRTRLQKDEIKKLDDTTIQVSSSIPLLNIAAFTQGSDADIVKAVYGNEKSIPISRKAELAYPGYGNLVGGAALLGDSQTVIGSGTYTISFNKPIDLDDVIVLFEPALEMKMTVTLNGQEVTDFSQLDATMEGDKVSVSCKIYEMGTDTQIDPSLLPPSTKFEVTISEGGQVVKQNIGKDMQLTEYVLKNTDTEIRAAAIIEGFNPIAYSEKFTPTKYVPRTVYTITPSFGSDVKSVKLDSIAGNKDLTVCFTVYADGVAMTDAEAVKALHPVVTATPSGNKGTVTYAADGKIVFTPHTASQPTGEEESFEVDVTCTIDNGTTAGATYTVLIAEYEVVALDVTQSIKKTAFFGNRVGASFYITKDGAKLGKEAVENRLSVALDEAHNDLETNLAVAADGTITVTPYTAQEHPLTFWSWWTNWAYYFGLEGSDVTVTMSHSYGSASSNIDVTEESVAYILLHVVAPLVLESALLITLIAYIYCIFAKPRFSKTAVLYAGNLFYDSYTGKHEVNGMKKVDLVKFNKLKYRMCFTTQSRVVSAGGVRIRALKGGRIECFEPGPAFKGNISFVHDSTLQLPADIMRYCREFGVSFRMEPFLPTERIERASVGQMGPTNRAFPTYFVAAAGLPGEGEPFVIRSGKIFVYLAHA